MIMLVDPTITLSRSHYAFPVSTTLLRRWCYANVVPTTLVLRQSSSYKVDTDSYAPTTSIFNMFKV